MAVAYLHCWVKQLLHTVAEKGNLFKFQLGNFSTSRPPKLQVIFQGVEVYYILFFSQAIAICFRDNVLLLYK